MSYIDANLLFSSAQAAFASGADVVSTNIVDLAPHLAANAAYTPDTGTGEDVLLEVVVTTSFAGGTSIQPVLQTDTNTNFATALAEFPLSGAILTATAIAGYKWSYRIPAKGLKRYLRLAYRNVGVMTAGAVTSYITKDAQLNSPTAIGYTVG